MSLGSVLAPGSSNKDNMVFFTDCAIMKLLSVHEGAVVMRDLDVMLLLT